MNISIIPISQTDKEVLASLLSEYQRELTGKNTASEYKYLDSYWENGNRFPFYIMNDGKRVGFVLVNRFTLVLKNAWSIAEYYVLKEFRNKGVGKSAAIKIFETFPGKWEVREMDGNTGALKFWRKVVDGYTKGNYEEIDLHDNQWSGPVQTFESKAK